MFDSLEVARRIVRVSLDGACCRSNLRPSGPVWVRGEERVSEERGVTVARMKFSERISAISFFDRSSEDIIGLARIALRRKAHP